MVIQSGKVLHREGYGLADLEKKAPIRPNTPFYLASMGMALHDERADCGN